MALVTRLAGLRGLRRMRRRGGNLVRAVAVGHAVHAVAPFLIDATGSVSRAYGVLGKGMHPGLPGHGFVLIDAKGIQRWYGEYPSMYLSTAGLIAQPKAHL